MFKTVLKVVAVFALLLGCYFGYVRAFDIIVGRFQARRVDELLVFQPRDSRSKQHAQELARRAFGDQHWAVSSELRYYNAERGFWMYAMSYEEIKDSDGKRVKLQPFTMIWTSGDGKELKWLTADRAILDMNQPIGISTKASNEAIKVEHAYIEGTVRIRDDRGTPKDPADDLNVGPLTYLEYDDSKRLITSESHVVIQDPEQTATGEGLEIRLRKLEANGTASASSSGFGGVEYAILVKNPRVAMRDVGNSGILPGGGPRPAGPGKAAKTVEVTVAAGTTRNPKPQAKSEPVPLVLQSQGPMRVDWPPDRPKVIEGPPEPPAPTLVRFERDVVALHGRIDRDPNQLNCDTLRLTLIPGSPAPTPPRRAAAGAKSAAARPGAGAGESAGAGAGVAAVATAAAAAPTSRPDVPADGRSTQGLFGNLTLEKAHATGHTVWLQMRAQGTKVRCNEMIHERSLPYRPDRTYFRGDRTRPIYMEKIDYEPEEPADPVGGRSARAEPAAGRERAIRSITHVRTISATIYDRGDGLDLADVRAAGPGRLESRPDPKEPVDRIADWQDELIIVNVARADGTLDQKQVTLTGTRPMFVDLNRKTSIDAAQEIKVFLQPRSTLPTAAVPVATAGTDAGAARGMDASTGPAADTGATSGLGGNLQIKRLLAYRDVHFEAPNRRMEARLSLDAPFVEHDPVPAATSSGPPAAAQPRDDQGAPAPAPAPESTEASGAPPAADQAARPTPAAEPTMTGVADRIFARVAIPRGQGLDADNARTRKGKARKQGAGAGPRLAATGPPADASGSKEPEAEVREAWLTGNVALHQVAQPDPDRTANANAKPKPKANGEDIFGEAVYLDNKGKGKANVRVFNRDPFDKTTPRLGPIQWARVATDDMVIHGETLVLDQEHDKVWAYGPGFLNQWTERTLLSDKASESTPPARGDAGRGNPAARPAVAANAARSGNRAGPPAPPKSRTRAGRPIGDRDLLTISWTKQMEFTGRTKDPSGHAAARADFLGTVNAKMTDATLHCEQKMIVFTDREVPLNALGSSIRGPGKGGARDDEREEPADDDEVDGGSPGRSRVDIALILCFGKPTAISRKVDPELPVVLEQERIDAWLEGFPRPDERLDYNRRTGEFFVPGPGMVFLYDRPEEKRAPGTQAPGAGDAVAAGGRTVTPTSARASGRPNGRSPARGRAAAAGAQGAAVPVVRRRILPLVLMQVQFTRGMRGRMGAGQGTDTREARWSEFFGDIEFVRSQVTDRALRRLPGDKQEVLDPDRPLSEDGFYLTSQMLRVIQEPPPAGSPEKTPARSYAKAWDRVHVNKGETFAIESDVVTYDSATDVIWAYGEGQNGVTYIHQNGPGQQPSQSSGKALQYNLQTHAGYAPDSNAVNLIDYRTGARPGKIPPPDPTAPRRKKRKAPFSVPNTNIERRGFTGY